MGLCRSSCHRSICGKLTRTIAGGESTGVSFWSNIEILSVQITQNSCFHMQVHVHTHTHSRKRTQRPHQKHFPTMVLYGLYPFFRLSLFVLCMPCRSHVALKRSMKQVCEDSGHSCCFPLQFDCHGAQFTTCLTAISGMGTMCTCKNELHGDFV